MFSKDEKEAVWSKKPKSTGEATEQHPEVKSDLEPKFLEIKL